MGRLMLWIIPRSKSTILLKSLSSNPEIKCIFEPFAFAYFAYFYDDEFTFDHLRECVKKEPFTCDNIVWKDVPFFVENHDFEKWFDGTDFKHALLVRHPKEVALSKIVVNDESIRFMQLPKMLKDHSTVEQNYEVMMKLRDYLESKGHQYKVFDTTNLGNSESREIF